MENLIQRQSGILEEMQKMYNNYGKDSATRKTPDYYVKRLNTLDKWWEEVNENNNKLQKEEDKTHNYYKNDIFSYISNYYKTTRLNMTRDYERMATSQPSTSKTLFQIPAISEPTELEKELQNLISKQYFLFQMLERLMSTINKREFEINHKLEIEDNLRSLSQRWEIIEGNQIRIESLTTTPDQEYNDKYASIEDKYNNTRRNLFQKQHSSVQVQPIPQMEIPIFSGKYTQWPTFCDLYTAVIHNNNSLTNAQKMQHLKCKVKGEAKRIIQHLSISAENYETAWGILENRYSNSHQLFSRTAEVLLNQPNIHKQSAHELKRLYDTTTECMHAIKNLGVNTDSWDPLIVHILTKKLDPDTYTNYMETRKEKRSIPDYSEFMSFIENKFMALEPIQSKERDRYSSSKSVYQAPRNTNHGKPASASQYNQYHQKGFYQTAPTFKPKPIYNKTKSWQLTEALRDKDELLQHIREANNRIITLERQMEEREQLHQNTLSEANNRCSVLEQKVKEKKPIDWERIVRGIEVELKNFDLERELTEALRDKDELLQQVREANNRCLVLEQKLSEQEHLHNTTLDKTNERIITLERQLKERENLYQNTLRDLEHLQKSHDTLVEKMSILDGGENNDTTKSLLAVTETEPEDDGKDWLRTEAIQVIEQLRSLSLQPYMGRDHDSGLHSNISLSSLENDEDGTLKQGALVDVCADVITAFTTLKGSRVTDSIKALEKERLIDEKNDMIADLSSKLSMAKLELQATAEERDRLLNEVKNSTPQIDKLNRACMERDEAMERKETLEVTLAKTRMELMQVNSQLCEAVRQKTYLGQQLLELWQMDIQDPWPPPNKH